MKFLVPVAEYFFFRYLSIFLSKARNMVKDCNENNGIMPITEVKPGLKKVYDEDLCNNN